MKHKTTGAVIAGGASRRFGSPKAFAKKDGKPFYQISVDVLRPFVKKVCMVTSPELASFFQHDDIGLQVIEDVARYQGHGPLAGIYTAMEACNTEWLITLPVDVPFMKPKILEILLHHASSNVEAVIPIVAGKMQPLIALFDCSVKERIKNQLDQGERRMDQLLEKINTHYVELDDVEAFLNINRQMEYKKYVGETENT
ncbi:molybdenum cofactor guanylyltransferase [Virgibacillus pantothenticus]|uniref:molybdenum cofactor guanylyltransferase n=1 Tax=Virgibacillus pantothenticus TaxID=1473 RepID=UPI000986BA0A|nr:molybdenum cofactor guanylyltransferase [Virgibacillus pantothenticus]